MRFRSQVHNVREVVFRKKFLEEIAVCDIAFHKRVIRFGLNVAQVFKIARVRERIEVVNVILRIGIHQSAHNV
jgi:hypothetical protein